MLLLLDEQIFTPKLSGIEDRAHFTLALLPEQHPSNSIPSGGFERNFKLRNSVREAPPSPTRSPYCLPGARNGQVPGRGLTSRPEDDSTSALELPCPVSAGASAGLADHRRAGRKWWSADRWTHPFPILRDREATKGWNYKAYCLTPSRLWFICQIPE